MDKSRDLAFQALSKRYDDKSLAHFYTLEISGQYSPTQKREILENWTKDFLVNIVSKELGHNNELAKKSVEDGNVSDILFIQTKEKTYKVADPAIESFFNFIRFKPSQLKYSFSIFDQSQKITTILANKLLKTLEEPPEGHIFIFLKSNDEKSLETIDSRTIRINITPIDAARKQEKTDNFNQFVTAFIDDQELVEVLSTASREQLKLDDLHDLIKEQPTREALIHQAVASYLSQISNPDMRKTQQCLDAISKATYEIPFNGAAKSRLARLLSIIM